VRQRLDLSKNQTRVPKSKQTPAELTRLVLLVKDGDKDAQDDLWWRMRPLVYRLSMKYGHGSGGGDGHTRYPEDLREEILQEAWIGLADAVARWEPDHDGGMSFWSYATGRITFAIKEWQGANSGSVSLKRWQWELLWRIQKALEAADVYDWELLSKEHLHAITGVKSAYELLWARQSKLGSVFEDEVAGYQSAEADYWDAQDADQWADILAWLRGLEGIPQEYWEEATYWKLEQMGMAGEIEAALLVERREYILEDRT